MVFIVENKAIPAAAQINIETAVAGNDVIDRLTSVGIDIKYTWAIITVGNRNLAGTVRIDVLDSLLDAASDFNITVGDEVGRLAHRVAFGQDKGRPVGNGRRTGVIVLICSGRVADLDAAAAIGRIASCVKNDIARTGDLCGEVLRIGRCVASRDRQGLAVDNVDLRERVGKVEIATAVVVQLIFENPGAARNSMVVFVGNGGIDRILPARFVKHETVVFFPNDVALDTHERIEQPVVRIDQIHAVGSLTEVVIEVLDRDRGVGAVECEIAVDRKRTLAVFGHVAKAAEFNAAGSATNNEIIDLSCTIDANPTFVIKL